MHAENHGTPWTSYEDATVREAWASGRSAEIIAGMLGRTPGAIVCRLQRLQIITPGEASRLSEKMYCNAASLRETPTRWWGVVSDLSGSRDGWMSPCKDSHEEALAWLRLMYGELKDAGVTFSVLSQDQNVFEVDLIPEKELAPRKLWLNVSVEYTSDRVRSEDIDQFLARVSTALNESPGVSGARVVSYKLEIKP